MKRVKLTHGTARVEDNCSPKTIKALDKLSQVVYNLNLKDKVPYSYVQKVVNVLVKNSTHELEGESEHILKLNEQQLELVAEMIAENAKIEAEKWLQSFCDQLEQEINEATTYRQVNGKMCYIVHKRGLLKTLDELKYEFLKKHINNQS